MLVSNKTLFYLLHVLLARGGGGNAIHVPYEDVPPIRVKSAQSALSDLLSTSATHGTFSRPSTKRGLILIGLELNTNATESFEHC